MSRKRRRERGELHSAKFASLTICSDQSDVIALEEHSVDQLLTTIRLDTSPTTKTNNWACLFSRSPASNAVNYSPNVLFVARTLFASFVSSNLNICIIFSIFFLALVFFSWWWCLCTNIETQGKQRTLLSLWRLWIRSFQDANHFSLSISLLWFSLLLSLHSCACVCVDNLQLFSFSSYCVYLKKQGKIFAKSLFSKLRQAPSMSECIYSMLIIGLHTSSILFLLLLLLPLPVLYFYSI